jgi:hypothetical protein
MPQCSPTTLIIPRPTLDAAARVASAPNCNTVSPTLCQDSNLLSPRPKRTKVREQIKDFILLSLGGPVLDLEFDIQQIDLCVDYALQLVEYYAPREFFNYYTFRTVSGQSVYTLPPDIGYVRHVFYRETGIYQFQASDLGGAIPLDYFYPGGSYGAGASGLINPIMPMFGRVSDWTLFKSYEQQFSKYSSAIGGWEFVDDYSSIKLYPVPCQCVHVIVHYLQKNKDWGCVQPSMLKGALAWAKQILGRIRSKYKNIPGPQGGIVLDGDQLLQEGIQEWKDFEAELIQKYGDLPFISYG